MKTDEIAVSGWQEIVMQKDSRIAELEALVKWYEEQLRLAKHRQFGPSSEKTQMSEQINLFDEAENTADPDLPEPTLTQITYKRRKRVGKRADDLSGLPVETVEHVLPEEERICPSCGGRMHAMGHECRRELKVIPAQVVVVEHKREVYSCRACEKNSDRVPILKAPLPEPLIKGSLASPSAVAHIMTQKYAMYAPMYRQEQAWKQQGIFLSRQTMANWVIQCAMDWLMPIYMRLKTCLLIHDILQADETTVQILREPGRRAQAKSYMWLYRTGGDTKTPVALYEYQQTRHHEHPEAFLKNFKGYLLTDGLAQYHLLNVTSVGCWAHARRRFDEALKAVEPQKRPGSHAQKGQDFCNRLFALERIYADMTPKERHKRRLKESQPVAEAFFAWAAALRNKTLPKSALGQALTYACEQKPYLMNIYLDGRLEISNNRAERGIKPFVMGRKNWLFCNTPKGAQASSIVYSIIETAKENGLKPFEYLEFLFQTLPNATVGQIDSLLPWGEAVPERCRMPMTKEENACA